MEIYAKDDLIIKIKSEIPNFDAQGLIEYTKFAIPNIHMFLSKENLEKIKKYCSDKLIHKFKKDKTTYRISKNIDNVRVGYTRLDGYINKDNKFYIKVYSSVFFYDDIDNNINSNENDYDKYWNDIWVITYEGHECKTIMNKCPACGASMKYDNHNHMFACDYCRNSLYYSQINWKMVDVEVNGGNYK